MAHQTYLLAKVPQVAPSSAALPASHILVAGLSRAGKSTLADEFCRRVDGSVHLPLDRYFKDVPTGQTFLEWVQTPDSVDWGLVVDHLALLAAGHECCTPVFDWRVTGRRLHGGGREGHRAALRMRAAPRHVLIVGCWAFAFGAPAALRVFVEASADVLLARTRDMRTARPMAATEAHADLDPLATHVGSRYREVLRQGADADLRVDGTAPPERNVALVLRSLRATSPATA